MRPTYSAKERFSALKSKVKGSWFRMEKLKDLVDKEIADARGKAIPLRTAGNRYKLDAELYQNAMIAFEKALKGEPLPEMYQEEYKKQKNISGDFQDEALTLLIAQNRRKWVSNRNDAGKRLQAVGEWDVFAKTLQAELDELGRQVASYA